MNKEDLKQELYDLSDGEMMEVNGFLILKVGCCYDFRVFKKDVRCYQVSDDKVGLDETLELVLKS